MKTMKNGSRMNRLVRAVPSLVLVAAIGHFAAARAEAAPQPSHQDIQNSVGAVQTTVNGLGTKVDGVQTTVNGIGTNVDAVQATVSGMGTKVDGVQTTANGIDSKVNATQTTVNGIGTKVENIGSTLEQIPPAWSQILPATQRFQLVMGGAAVLDKETGLVWEQSPATTPLTWPVAQYECMSRAVGGRRGWRLPTSQELASLMDPTQSDPALPSGHPFGNVQSAYWSATTRAGNASWAWVAYFYDNMLRIVFGPEDKSGTVSVWCVRGGQGVDAQ